MPGLLSKISISKPESSARQGKLVFFEKYFDFRIEFPSNVLQFSIGLLRLNLDVEKTLIYLGSNALISLYFPLLFVPINISVIFFHIHLAI
jgi:hypothetical protein